LTIIKKGIFQTEEHRFSMGFLEYLLLAAVIAQVFFTIQVACNHHYAVKKSNRKRVGYRPECVLIVPCKGLDEEFDKNIESFYRQEYENYHLYFVVEDQKDPAYDHLLNLILRYR